MKVSPVIVDSSQDAGVLPAEWTAPAPLPREQLAAEAGRVAESFVPVRRLGPLRPTPAQIRERAYYIYLERGGAPGDPVADWLQAERELEAEYRAAYERSRRSGV
ncbi:MAG: DUF2934 domain-containing protein [Planctomycetota bacterium]|nr:MAG: DUF2934 domain-containing protein [Planctomycetota bacterium]